MTTKTKRRSRSKTVAGRIVDLQIAQARALRHARKPAPVKPTPGMFAAQKKFLDGLAAIEKLGRIRAVMRSREHPLIRLARVAKIFREESKS